MPAMCSSAKASAIFRASARLSRLYAVMAMTAASSPRPAGGDEFEQLAERVVGVIMPFTQYT
jgi:hypothetical protein